MYLTVFHPITNILGKMMNNELTQEEQEQYNKAADLRVEEIRSAPESDQISQFIDAGMMLAVAFVALGNEESALVIARHTMAQAERAVSEEDVHVDLPDDPAREFSASLLLNAFLRHVQETIPVVH